MAINFEFFIRLICLSPFHSCHFLMFYLVLSFGTYSLSPHFAWLLFVSMDQANQLPLLVLKEQPCVGDVT